MNPYKYDEQTGLWYEYQGDFYLPCLTQPEAPRICIWGQGITDDLKTNDQMAWVQRMNAIRNTALEQVHEEMIYA